MLPLISATPAVSNKARADELLLYIVRQDHVPFAPVDVAVSLSFVTELLDSADEFSLDRVGLTARGHVGMPQCACFLLVLHSAQHRCYRHARPGHLGALTAAMGVRSRQPVDRSSHGHRGPSLVGPRPVGIRGPAVGGADYDHS